MKFALVNGKKVEATKGSVGQCQACNSELLAKCGEVNVHHWSHKTKRSCDAWWESEGEWHRSWKNQFPAEWQEVVHHDDTGEKHIADVKTATGWVFEFQHSHIQPEERRSRNKFYRKLVWVVDGARRKTDNKQFGDLIKEYGRKVPNADRIVLLEHSCKNRLLKEWGNCNSLVFLDFGGCNQDESSFLWFLFPPMASGSVYLSFMERSKFISLGRSDDFDNFFQKYIGPAYKELSRWDAKRNRGLFF